VLQEYTVDRYEQQNKWFVFNLNESSLSIQLE